MVLNRDAYFCNSVFPKRGASRSDSTSSEGTRESNQAVSAARKMPHLPVKLGLGAAKLMARAAVPCRAPPTTSDTAARCPLRLKNASRIGASGTETLDDNRHRIHNHTAPQPATAAYRDTRVPTSTLSCDKHQNTRRAAPRPRRNRHDVS